MTLWRPPRPGAAAREPAAAKVMLVGAFSWSPRAGGSLNDRGVLQAGAALGVL